jgi:hypothetical protein|tara:strand:- start:290 stop:823 length:534 start_codon:yes stop_codon:yes gene_type:complete
MKNHKFVTARFINNEKTTVEIEWLNDAEDTVIEITEFEEDNLVWVDLLTHTTLDDIHENTIKWMREQRAVFEEVVSRIAELDNTNDDAKKIPGMVASLFNNIDDDDDIFALKLALFEIKGIRESKNTAMKTQLRKSTNKFDVLRRAFDIIEETVIEPTKKPTKKGSKASTSQTTPSP